MYALKEAVSGMVRTPYMTILSIVTIMVTLTVLGVFSVVTVLGNQFINKIRKSEEINVYLGDDLSDEDMLALDAVIRSMEEVESTRIMSKEDAAREFEKMFGENLLDAINENPLPRTIVIRMADGHRMSADLEAVASRVGKAKGVESVEYGHEWMSRLDVLFVFFLIGETVLIVLTVGACVLVISNTISLTVLARREPIEIMRLVGATDSFIRRPFYYEGFLQGLIAGAMSSAVLFYAYRWAESFSPRLDAYLYMFVSPKLLLVSPEWYIFFLVPVGGLTGLFGSFVAVRRVF